MRDTGFPDMGYCVWVGLLNNYCGKIINKEQRKKVSQFLKYMRKKHKTSNDTHNHTALQTHIKVLKLQLNQQTIDLQKAQKKIQRQERSLSHIKQITDSNITELVTIDWHNKLEEYLTQVKAYLEQTTYKTYKSWLKDWVTTLRNEGIEPSSMFLKQYLTNKYKRSSSYNRVGK